MPETCSQTPRTRRVLRSCRSRSYKKPRHQPVWGRCDANCRSNRFRDLPTMMQPHRRYRAKPQRHHQRAAKRPLEPSRPRPARFYRHVVANALGDQANTGHQHAACNQSQLARQQSIMRKPTPRAEQRNYCAERNREPRSPAMRRRRGSARNTHWRARSFSSSALHSPTSLTRYCRASRSEPTILRRRTWPTAHEQNRTPEKISVELERH